MAQINAEKIVKSYIYGNTIEMTTANGQQEQVIKVIEGKRYVNLISVIQQHRNWGEYGSNQCGKNCQILHLR